MSTPPSYTPNINKVNWADCRLILLASLGGALEFYDFVVYSQFAQYIGKAFFQSTDALLSLVLSFSTFAVGYFARPLGGYVCRRVVHAQL